MLVGEHGARMKQGDIVLVWGATGGIGGYAVQYVLNGGGTPVGVVSSPEQGEAAQRAWAVEAVIDRSAEGYRFWSDEHTQDEAEWRRFGKQVRELVGDDPDIVFEHPGRQTMGASIFACKRGGTVVTCAATSGYMVEFDNRHFWMKLKRLIASHFANYAEAWAANRLIDQGRIQPLLSAVYPLDEVGVAARSVHRNEHEGKLGVLCLAPARGPRHRRPREARPHRRGQDHRVPRRLIRNRWATTGPYGHVFAHRLRGHGCARESGGLLRDWRMLLTEIDHVAIAVRDLEAAIDYYQRAFGATVAHREIVESDGVEEALLKVADSYIQLLTADPRRLADRQGDRQARRGPAPRRLPRRRLRRGARGDGRGRRHRRSTRRRARAAAAPPWRSSTRRAASAR